MADTRIWSELDFDAPGKQVGYLNLPYSSNTSGYGTIAIPIGIVRNGSGPTVLIMGGIHGDEYEAQIVISRLIRELEPQHLSGAVILIPAINFPAAQAGARLSPLDDLNMNRVFPGDPNGSPTEQLAYYVDSVLLPRCDVWLDWHSGGHSMNYVPLASIHRFKDTALTDTNLKALVAFGAPANIIWSFFDEPRMAKGCAERHGLIYLGSEFGGGGTVNPAGIKLAYDGTLRVLRHVGLLNEKAPFEPPHAGAMAYFGIDAREQNVFAPQNGLFEPTCHLEDVVHPNSRVGWIHFIDEPSREPTPVITKAGGTVLCIRHPGITTRGDCVVQIGKKIEPK